MTEPTEMETTVAEVLIPFFSDSYAIFGDRGLSAARAAIRAMREPTSEMLAAGTEAMDQWAETPGVQDGWTSPANGSWQAMIDAALGEAPH